MMLILLLGFATSLFVASTNAGDRNEQPGSPHNWSGTMNPGWGSPWGGNWGTNSNMNMANNMASTGPNASIAHPGGTQVPVWPGQFFGQHPNMGPLGMFYPLNWGGYLYPIPHPTYNQPCDDWMIVNDNINCQTNSGQLDQTTEEMLHPNNPIGQEDAQMEPQGTSTSKGKEKASEEEVQQLARDDEEYRIRVRQQDVHDEPIPPEVLAIARRLHREDRVDKLEQRLKQAHESLATALQ
ncbi:hypothetical protein EDD18DRAFT_1111372 [Armillaria luteobubalina]|uniref:Secreted protein n=1 Tax=Armillaria luteobubalina TaxID=153913 RepID=A0AA39PJR6_9AGAR|nr:hypothetical protein EDD18DRAFT_1111372 [Armillaria luteobubalina]